MAQQTLSLGERILLVARLAVEEHLLQTVCECNEGEAQVTIGGAGLDGVTDDSLTLARGRVPFGLGARLAEGEAA